MSDNSFSAAFIDFENFYYSLTDLRSMTYERANEVSISMIDTALNRLKDEAGDFIIKQAFADWEELPEAKKELQKMGIRVEDVLSTAHKNSADIEMSLSIQDVVLTRPDIQTILILAGDRDYMPIALRTREMGRKLLLAGLKESLSGDLKKMVGKEYYYYVDPENYSVYKEDQSHGNRTQTGEESQIKELTIEQLKTAQACIEAYDEYRPKYGSVKLGAFLVDRLAKALPNLDHMKRKEVLTSITEIGMIDIAQRRSFLGDEFFAVFTVNEENELIKKIRNETGGS